MPAYQISEDKNLLSVKTIYRFLSEESYWAKGRTLETVNKTIENSLCFGVYMDGKEQVGFARVVTDYSTMYYICDLFVLPQYRGGGLGRQLVAHIVNHPKLKDLSGLLLTSDAHGLYRKYGFSDDPEVQQRFMIKRRPKIEELSGTIN